jgi:hypothetical protein
MEPHADEHLARQRLQTDDLVAWRRHVLINAGFAAGLADELAADRQIDLHDVLMLVDAGCPPHLAARILAPL